MGVSDRVSLATRLFSLDHGGGEPYQIANYGIGGVYNQHPDPHGYHQRTVQPEEGGEAHVRGDRLATAMGYLSHVR